MAKKIQSKQEKMLDNLFSELGKIAPEELERMLQGLTDDVSKMADFPQVTHTYSYPDYAARARPVASYLQTIDQLGWNFNLPETYIQELLSYPSAQLADELENLIVNGLATYHQLSKDDLPTTQSKYIIALLLFKEIRSESSLDILLELLRQDNLFFDTYFEDSGFDLFPVIIYSIGFNQLPKLLNFIKEPGLLPFGKAYVATAVSNIACTTPERRLEVISWYCQVLGFYLENVDNDAIFDSLIIDSLSYDLLNIHAKETLPLLEKIYATNLIIPIISPDFKGIRKNINKAKTTELDDRDIYESLDYLETVRANFGDEDDDKFEDTFFALPQQLLEERMEKEVKPTKKQNKAVGTPCTEQCFTLRISLRDIRPEIWRLVEIPSTLTLPQLHEVIQTVMGWDGMHLHQFKKGKTYYMSEEQLEADSIFSTSPMIEYSDVTLEEVLPRKRSKIGYEYDFGDGWEHDVVLEAYHPYAADEAHRIFLIDGANACPPEDCGGYSGFMELCEAMKNRRTKIYREYVEWLGGIPFDPRAFGDDEKEEINEMLEGIL